MQNLERPELRAEEFEVSVQPMQRDLRTCRVGGVRIEYVGKHAFDDFRRIVIGIERQLLLSLERKRTQIVETENVIRMSVGVQNSIKPRDLFPQRLLAEVRSAVDQHDPPAVLQHD